MHTQLVIGCKFAQDSAEGSPHLDIWSVMVQMSLQALRMLVAEAVSMLQATLLQL